MKRNDQGTIGNNWYAATLKGRASGSLAFFKTVYVIKRNAYRTEWETKGDAVIVYDGKRRTLVLTPEQARKALAITQKLTPADNAETMAAFFRTAHGSRFAPKQRKSKADASLLSSRRGKAFRVRGGR